MEIVLWTIAGLLALQLAFVVWNVRQLPSLGGTGAGRQWLDGGSEAKTGSAGRDSSADLGGEQSERAAGKPLLSVLIPARNEAGNIAPCIRSVLADPSPLVEVVVLDDRSEDDTRDVAVAAGGGDGRLKVLSGLPLPQGWLGKSHACWQLAYAARGSWLLFLDADARLAPGALSDAMDTALAQGSGLITGFPRQHTGSWAEKLVVPMMSFTIVCHLPIRLVRRSSDPKFVAAHGAFMLILRESYRAIGGHAAFKAHLVDDMQLARAVKRAALPVTLADISRQVSMRMYSDAAGVWNGYKKNMFSGVGRSALLLVSLLAMYAGLYLLPPAALAAGIGWGGGAQGWLLPSLIGWLLGIAIKWKADRHSGQPAYSALLLPASIAMLAGIGLASWRAAASGRGYVWKGRRYL